MDQENYTNAVKKFYKSIDHLENSQERKGLQIDNSYLDFGTLRYEERQVKTVTVGNTSKVWSLALSHSSRRVDEKEGLIIDYFIGSLRFPLHLCPTRRSDP